MRIAMAGRLVIAFVHVLAMRAVAAEAFVGKLGRTALAHKAADGVFAFGVGVAVVGVGGAFVNVATFNAIALEAWLAFAVKSAEGIDAIGVGVAVVLVDFAFVHILACKAVSFEVLKVGQSRAALAGKRANQIRAFGIGIARD